jgi:hypothetical protein
VNDILAKLSQNEKLMGLGAIGVAVGWILGMVIASKSACAGLDLGGYASLCPSVNFFTWGNAGLFAILALAAAIVLVVVMYLKISSANITWPMPVSQILLGLGVLTVVLAALTVLMQVSNGLGDAPIGMWIADVVFVGGGAVAAYGSYMEYAPKK